MKKFLKIEPDKSKIIKNIRTSEFQSEGETILKEISKPSLFKTNHNTIQRHFTIAVQDEDVEIFSQLE